jgi:Zn-dependent M28 family amino/carboxypeptidase
LGILASYGLGRAVAAPAPPPTPGAAADLAHAWWAHVQYLADDKLEGRLTGSVGYRKAAEYVAARFKEYGLAPAGTDGYFQPVRFEVQRVISGDSSLALVRDGRTIRLSVPKDAILSTRNPQPAKIEAPLYFAGYALHLPEAGYDDFAGQDLKGKIVVYVNGGPREIAGSLKSHARAAQEFLKAMEAAGAVGAVVVPNPASADIPWSRTQLSASQPGMRLAEAELQDTHAPFFVATFNPERADDLFAASGHTVGEIMALATDGKPMPRFDLKTTLRATVASRSEQVEAPNVAAVLTGSDPTLKAQYVVLSAHLDHLGIGEPIDGDRIYNGAMDNASGVASLLEIARAMQAGDKKPRRSILFVALCGEEKGLLGSRYFANHPTVAPSALVADLNMDMFLPLFPLHFLTVEGLEESTLGDDARTVAAGMGVEVVADRAPDLNVFIRSDQYNFIRKGVPGVAFTFGAAPYSREEATLRDFLTRRYHAPSDDVKQPVDTNAAVSFDQLLLALTLRVADADTVPSWKAKSFFRRFAAPPAGATAPAAAGGGGVKP